MASVGMRSLEIGAQPAGYAGGDAFHYPQMRMLVAARAHGLQAIDGPYTAIGDTALRRAAASVAALGFDGKWVLHPGQIDPVNEAFSPDQEEYDRAELILEAYEHYTTVEQRGAAMLGDEMIDEASRKLALVAAARGRAAGLARTQAFQPPATPQASRPPLPQARAFHEVSAATRPSVRRPARSMRASSRSVTQRASAASSPAARTPPVTNAA